MNGHLEISRQEEPNPDHKKRRMDRRSFLKLAGYVVAPTAVFSGLGEVFTRLEDFAVWSSDRKRRMRFERFGGLPPKEREKVITEEARQAHSFLHSQEGKRILESGTDNEIFSLLTSMPALLREHITDTSYDIPKEKWPSVAVGVTSRGEPYALSVNYDKKAIAKLYRGNGVFVAPDTMLTNWHVLAKQNEQGMTASGAPAILGHVRIRQLFESQEIDAVYVRFGKPATLENPTSFPNIYALSPTLRDADVSGNLITVAGIDPDESAASDGTKIYPSVAIPITRRLRVFMEKYVESPDGGSSIKRFKFIENGFMYIAPPGESALRPYLSKSDSRFLDVLREPNSNKERMTLLQGTSGSPVLLNGEELAGLNSRSLSIQYQGVSIDLGFFHGPDALHRAKESGMETLIY